MATTKRTRCYFKVKEGMYDPFIDAEPCSGESHSENPDTDLLWLDLRSGISWDEAQRVADFLNDHIPSISRTKFGDQKDLVRDAKQDLRKQRDTANIWKAVLEKMRASLLVEDFSEALENLYRLEVRVKNLLADWKQVVERWQFDVSPADLGPPGDSVIVPLRGSGNTEERR